MHSRVGNATGHDPRVLISVGGGMVGSHVCGLTCRVIEEWAS